MSQPAVLSPTPSRGPALIVRLLTAPLTGRTWRSTIFVTLGGLVAVVTVGPLWALAASGLALVFALFSGIVVLWIALLAAHLLARFEAGRSQNILGVGWAPRRFTATGTWPARIWSRLRSGSSWLELLYGLIVLPVVGLIGCGLVVSAWAIALLYLAYPAYGWMAVAHSGGLSWGLPYLPSAVLHVIAGAYVALIAPWVAIGIAQGQHLLGRFLLSASREEELTARVETLTESRAGLVDAVDAERRRIERDLHDGAQQRLVAVAMTLGRAGQQFDLDPENARRLVEEAHGETKAALVDLRNLARGIHPAVLTDRGLDAALSALAERTPVPVDLSVLVKPRPSATIEAVAYFVVSEALTNIAKHSHATRARVSALRIGDRLILEIVDDGVGGAQFGAGTGLAGLRDRARSVDGTFELTSPAGGPTALRVELPCES